MKTITNVTENKLIIKKSTFITTLIPCDNIEDVPYNISTVKDLYPDARHYCIAYNINGNLKADDDGEPSGTAGMPMLNVIQKQELSNILVVVTRYFGGIKLGAGGLTRAYTQSVAQAIQNSEIVTMEKTWLYEIVVDYSFTKKIEHLITTNRIILTNTNYADKVHYYVYLINEDFLKTVQELTSNNYQYNKIKEDYIKRED